MGISQRPARFGVALGVLTIFTGVALAQPTTPQGKNGAPGPHSKWKPSTTTQKTPQNQQQSNQDLIQALKELHSIEQSLSGADHDYGGHRVAAMHDIHEAQHALREALKQSHQGQNHNGSTTGNHTGPTTGNHPSTQSGGKSTGGSSSPSSGQGSSHPEPQKVSNQQLYAATGELKQTIGTLHQAKHDYGGHRAQALKDLEKAVHELEQAEHYAKEHDRKKP